MIRFFKAAAMISIMTVFVMPLASAQTVTSSVRLVGDLHPQSDEDAKVLLYRVKNAAAEACGAFDFSMAEYGRAVRRSPCWRQSVWDAVTRIDSPILSEVYARESH
jgi:UrcA family protein